MVWCIYRILLSGECCFQFFFLLLQQPASEIEGEQTVAAENILFAEMEVSQPTSPPCEGSLPATKGHQHNQGQQAPPSTKPKSSVLQET